MADVHPEEWNSLCEIFVPVDNNRNGKIATAYPIAKDRIITCAHVLDGLLKDKPPEVRWHLLEPDGDYRVLEQDYLEFDGRKHDVDAAILRVRLPHNASIAPLLPSCPRTGPVQAMGFPAVGKRENKREQTPIDGKLLSYAEAQTGFTIAADAPPNKDGGWKGASGSPVFLSGRLVGVYIECPEPFNNRRVHATPLYRLLRIDEFRDAIGFDEQHPGFMRLRSKAIGVLTGAPGLTAALVGSLGLEDVDKGDATTPDIVFSTLIADDAADLLGHLLHVLEVLLKKDSGEESLSALDGLAFALLPVVYRTEDVQEFCRVVVHDAGPVILCAANSLMLAEALMAGVDGREMILSARHARLSPGRGWHADDPPGEFLLHPPPDSGIDKGGVRQEADFVQGLCAKFLVDSETDLNRALSWEFCRDADPVLDEDTYKTIRQILEDTLTYEKRHYYFVYRQAPNEDRPPIIDRLARNLPRIVFVGLPRRMPSDDAHVRALLNRLRLRKVDP